MINRAIVQGNLCRTPESDTVGKGDKKTDVVKFTVATTRKYGKKEETCFVDCTAWGKLAETIVKFFDKGKPIIVEGRLCQDVWEEGKGKNKRKRSKHYVTVDGFHFCGGPKEEKDVDKDEPEDKDVDENVDDDDGDSEDDWAV